jgi:hypothetical protein
VRAACGEEIEYVWEKDGQILPASFTSEITLREITPEDAGIYRVRVSSRGVSLWSAPARLNLEWSVPRWQRDRGERLVVGEGQPLVLESRAQGPGVVRYRWRHNGAEIPGSEGPRLEVAAVTRDAAGVYEAEAFNEGGRVLSEPKRVDVLGIVRNPSGSAACVG